MTNANACPAGGAVSAPTTPSMLEYALQWAARGLRVFPVRGGSKFPPLVKNWPEVASSDPTQILEWWRRWPEANIGATGAVVLDVDVRDGKPGVESLKALDLPSSVRNAAVVVETPSGGLHLYYAQPEGALVASQNAIRPGLDLKADRGYVLAPGSKLEGVEQCYEVFRDPGALSPCPPCLAELARAESAPRKEPDRNVLAKGAVVDDPAVIIEAADWLASAAPPAIEGQNGDQTTYKVACDLRDKGLSQATAFDLMADHYNPRCEPPWDLDGPKSLSEKVESAWRSAQNPIGAKHPGAIAASEFAGVILPPVHQGATDRRFRLDPYWAGAPLPPAPPSLLRGILPRSGVVAVIAPSMAGKTTLVLELGRVLATGAAFFGVFARESCGMLVLAAEGMGGLRGRAFVLSESGGEIPVAVSHAPPMSGPADIAHLVEAITHDIVPALREKFGVRLGAVVLDTLSSSGLLPDENDNGAAAAVVSALNRAAQMLDCLFLFVHHPAKHGTASRGAYALFANIDAEITVEYEESKALRIVRLTKHKEAPAPRVLGCYTLQDVPLGLNEDGELDTACRIVSGDYTPEMSAKAGRAATLTSAQIRDCQDAIGGGNYRSAVQAEAKWAGHAIGRALGIDTSDNAERASVRSILSWLVVEGWLQLAHERDTQTRKTFEFVRVGESPIEASGAEEST